MDAVEVALQAMRARRWDRALSDDLHGQTGREELVKLRETMFTRRQPGEAFHELNQRELSLLESAIGGYELVGQRFRVLVGEQHPLTAEYAVLRRNLFLGEGSVAASDFRTSADRITTFLLNFVKEEYGIAAGTAIVLPWRAALTFAEPALQVGIRDFYHLGACRDEETLETQVYFEEVPPALQGYVAGGKRSGIVADPMLATGNTAIAGIERLRSQNVPEENIIVVAVISAPEGVDHVLQSFPGVKVVVGNHDECLNSKGYIVPGLGDFGDLYFNRLKIEIANAWREKGILSDVACATLVRRMTATAGGGD